MFQDMTLTHRLFGKLVSSRIGFALLKAYAFRTPHAHLHDPDGTMYMGRWRVVDEGTLGGRILHKLTGYKSIRLHHIMRPDHDRDLHNHPFAYRTFIARGWYCEHYEEDGHRSYRGVWQGNTATGSHDKYHRISEVSGGGVWTLFCMTENHETWGFKVNGRFVEATRYLLRRGYPKDSIRGVQTP
jgi:hypothetical protein